MQDIVYWYAKGAGNIDDALGIPLHGIDPEKPLLQESSEIMIFHRKINDLVPMGNAGKCHKSR